MNPKMETSTNQANSERNGLNNGGKTEMLSTYDPKISLTEEERRQIQVKIQDQLKGVLAWYVRNLMKYEATVTALESFLASEREKSNRLRNAVAILERALSRIDYLCGEPNEMNLSDYSLHCDEGLVVKNVESRLTRLRDDVEAFRTHWCETHGGTGISTLCPKCLIKKLTSERARRERLEEENKRLRAAVVKGDKIAALVREYFEEVGGPVGKIDKRLLNLAALAPPKEEGR